MPYFCKKIVRVVSSLGILPLCINCDSFGLDSAGIVFSKPPFSFVSIKKSSNCNHLRVSLLLYPFDLCLIPLNKPIEVTYREGKSYKTIILSP
jgi:hypothetical protein